jgi:Flp pilus assembly protein TadG
MSMLSRLVADRSGAAAAEMALSLPLLLVLTFGTFEMGYYFRCEHVVQKAVRDAARYAARLPMTSYPTCAPTAATTTAIQKVARTGTPDGTVQRLQGWTADSMVKVNVTCDTSGTYTGIYSEFPMGVPKIVVSASVPYPSVFGKLGLPAPALKLNAQSQTAAYGV